MKVKRIWILAIFLSLMLALVPRAFASAGTFEDEEANETKGTSAGVMSEEDWYHEEPTKEPANNDELFSGYVESVFYGYAEEEKSETYDAQPRADGSVDPKAVLRSKLLAMVKNVASGKISSTQIEISFEDLGYLDQRYTLSQLGVSSFRDSNGKITDETLAAMTAQLVPYDEITTMLRTLQAEYPYEFYWYDKTIGYYGNRPYTMNTTTYNGQTVAIFTEGSFILKLPVAKEYSKTNATGTYTADTTKTGAATASAANAKKIVSANVGLSDYEKLNAYKNKICELTAYNRPAANDDTMPYGNPWQLIWVFDNDPDTTVVCEGYSKAFKYLCDQSTFNSGKIKCYLVRGTMIYNGNDGLHMWNILTMEDGRNYMVDVTNSDGGSTSNNNLYLLSYYTRYDELDYVFDSPIGLVEYIYDDITTSVHGFNILEISADPYGSDISKPTVTTQPAAKTVDLDQSVTFKVVAKGVKVSYQWYYKKVGETSWTKWSGKTRASLTVTGSTTNNGCQYRCLVKNEAGSVYSSAATLTVVLKPEITTQPSAKTAAAGSDVTFKVVASSGASMTYQWQVSKDGGSTWSNINTTNYPSAKTAKLTFTASTGLKNYQYRCKVTNRIGTTTSKAAKLTIVTQPKITTQPTSQTAELGKSVTFKVTATGGGLSYQWQYKKVGGTWKTWSGKTSASVTVTASSTNGGCQYRCIVKNAAGSVTSSAATLTVTEPPVTITSQPSSKTAYLGKSVTFKVTATGSNLSYQWQYKKVGGTWKTWSGKTSASVTVTASSTNDGCQYRCIVSNSVGSVTSKAATLTVKETDIKITMQPLGAFVVEGERAGFQVIAEGTDLSYAWQVSKDGGATWKNINQTTYPSAATSLLIFETRTGMDGYLYRCVISNDTGSVTSEAGYLFCYIPSIKTQPRDQTVDPGDTATFQVEMEQRAGISYEFKWWVSIGGNGAFMPVLTSYYCSATGSTLPIMTDVDMDGNVYHCEVYYIKNGVRSEYGEYTIDVTLHVNQFTVGEINN